MRQKQINRALRRVRGVVPAVVLTAGLVAGGAVTAAPAFAAAGPLNLTAHGPAGIGFAGQPVEFTETIGNAGDQGFAVALELSVETSLGAPANAMSMDWRNDMTGGWEHLSLESRRAGDKVVFSTVAGKIIVPPGGTDVHLRLGVPMGTPHDGDSNGGVGPAVTLRSNVKGWWQDGPVEPEVKDARQIKVDSISNGIAGVPHTAVAGGAPIEFDAVLRNPTPSAYANLGNVLFTDGHAKLEVRGADGRWTALTAVPRSEADGGGSGFYLDGRDSSAAPGSTTTKRVRVTYPSAMPAGPTRLQPCVFVNESAGHPFRGTTTCSGGVDVQVAVDTAAKGRGAGPTTTPATGQGTGTGAGQDTNQAKPKPKGGAVPAPAPAAAVTTAPAAPGATATPAAAPASSGTVTVAAPAPAERLATTGADGDHTSVIAGLAAALLGVGSGAFALLRRRRSA
ncbi:LPXTG cell wall anchor domain-containing protein [Kitasatospora sp. RG8]|uniref:LPXTG cell wall anchor domain-containing protein n=1 Tax=Kitasatospora sp. RG8 TaxID=2820815 RepID=UPI001ADFDA5F|nr:LPXTG cell wall anchor domain-containing protein [Kitasatospora sp. RG8]MBP0454374.1 LPXTG cell wall anchor domain-containing protein [Kitasatospora sp. RG8]